ncbi:MAG: sulfatase-like hydrolase/transferase [Phycisphaera sp.]|nr:sulfatase-like hydrolase/transferase [Phycisphaera sp.]
MFSSRRIAAAALAALALVALAAFVTPVRAADTKPNIVFIFADDWGWGDLSCHGNEMYKTPNLDRLASQGTDFTQFTVDNPVCSPSRTAVMTGNYPARHSIHQHFSTVQHHIEAGMPDWLDPNVVMLPRLLQTGGYATAHFGKWHLTNVMIPDGPLPTKYGYDETAVFNGGGPQVNANPNIDKPLSTDMAIDFMRRHKDRPFFINLWIHAAHTPHYPTPRWLDRFKHLDEQHRVYAAVIAEADERIGKVLDALDELKLADNTLVLFSSDNGPEITGKKKEQDDASTGPGKSTFYSVGSTGGQRGRKRSLYQGGVGVPFIVRWPGHTPAGRVDKTTVVTAVDLLPTFCAAAGVTLPDGYEPDGVNILPALNGRPFERDKPIFWEWRGASFGDNWPRLAVRDAQWKLVMNNDGSRMELYDLTADRAQASDLAKANPQVVQRLAAEALAWQKTLPTAPPQNALSSIRKKK